MSDINKILRDYTAGEADLETTNTALAEAGAGYHLEPGHNEITEKDRRETAVGYYPEQALGWGLLDTGTGTLDKAWVEFEYLQNPVNEVLPDGSVNMEAYITICGKIYRVLGSKLSEMPADNEASSDGCKVPRLLVKVDLRWRPGLAGQTVTRRTKTGQYDVTYDGQGYAVRAERAQR